MARPSKNRAFNWDLFNSLCALPSSVVTQDEIVFLINAGKHAEERFSKSTVQRLVKHKQKTSFDQYRKQKQIGMRVTLASKQYEFAIKGNTALLIWLGKQYLGQSDQPIPEDRPEIYEAPESMRDE